MSGWGEVQQKDTAVVVHLEHAAVADGAVMGAWRLGGDAFLAHTHRLTDQRALGGGMESVGLRVIIYVFLMEV